MVKFSVYLNRYVLVMASKYMAMFTAPKQAVEDSCCSEVGTFKSKPEIADSILLSVFMTNNVNATSLAPLPQ